MENQDVGTVTLPPPARDTENTKPKTLPPYAVIVEDDDKHTFEYVMEVFQKVFGYSVEKVFKLAEEIHTNGESVVWSGSKEVAELKYELIRSAGPDVYSSTKVEFPLGVRIEPMPG
jgi:ATP-dependent Clp protease adaptor protein ClpS